MKMPSKFNSKYKGNIKSEGSTFPKPNSPTKANGGKVSSNLKKTAVAKKMK